jgi:NADH-quinone oxidoreductase subunit C
MDVRTNIKMNQGDWLSQFGDLWKQQVDRVKAELSGDIEEVWMPGEAATDVPVIFVKRNAALKLLAFLKTDTTCDYRFLADLTATDEGGAKRFELVYNLLSHTKKSRIRVKVRLAEGEAALSAVSVWPGANWAECEVWDMYGVRFDGHPNLRRLLMDDRWVGHPLRKDYPLNGYQFFPHPAEIDLNHLT